MLSFYQKLATKLNDGDPTEGAADTKPSQNVSPNAAVGKAVSKADKPDPVASEPTPEGTDSLDVDLFQSDSQMVIFIQMSGIGVDDLEVVADEDSNTLVVQATQKRPDIPPAPHAPAGAEPEKGRFVKQEVKWRALYRKIYLPASFNSSEAEVSLKKGILTVVLPVKHSGAGKKLVVKELLDEKKAA